MLMSVLVRALTASSLCELFPFLMRDGQGFCWLSDTPCVRRMFHTVCHSKAFLCFGVGKVTGNGFQASPPLACQACTSTSRHILSPASCGDVFLFLLFCLTKVQGVPQSQWLCGYVAGCCECLAEVVCDGVFPNWVYGESARVCNLSPSRTNPPPIAQECCVFFLSPLLLF